MGQPGLYSLGHFIMYFITHQNEKDLIEMNKMLSGLDELEAKKVFPWLGKYVAKVHYFRI